MPHDVIGVAIERWSTKKQDRATEWLYNTYGPVGPRSWYVDSQHLCVDLVMRKDIYFMFLAAFGEDFVNGS